MTVFAGDDELLAFLHHEPHEKNFETEAIDQALEHDSKFVVLVAQESIWV